MRKFRAEILLPDSKSWIGASVIFVEDEQKCDVIFEEIGKQEEGIETVLFDVRESVSTLSGLQEYLRIYFGDTHSADLLIKIFVSKLMEMALRWHDKYFFWGDHPVSSLNPLPPYWRGEH